jgi:Raf kinase inhibitor-like YbhB/YbcL family protein
MSFFLRIPAFSEGGRIPAEYTCQGKDISPELIWGDLPQGTKSLILICEDPDAPMGTWVHWVIFNIPATEKGLKQSIPAVAKLPNGILQGRNDSNRLGYNGPAPPPGSVHRYFFRLYALDNMLKAESGITKQKLLALSQNHILGKAEYYGTFSR